MSRLLAGTGERTFQILDGFRGELATKCFCLLRVACARIDDYSRKHRTRMHLLQNLANLLGRVEAKNNSLAFLERVLRPFCPGHKQRLGFFPGSIEHPDWIAVGEQPLANGSAEQSRTYNSDGRPGGAVSVRRILPRWRGHQHESSAKLGLNSLYLLL